jgi:hypothetical protein
VECVACTLIFFSAAADAIDIRDVQFVALDQPQIDVTMWLAPHQPDAPPLESLPNIAGDTSISFTAFLDTGASGIVLSQGTADAFGVPRATDASGSPITVSDTGIGGSAIFNVSVPLDFQLTTAPSILDPNPAPAPRADSSLNSVRAEIGPIGVPPDTFGFGEINIIGMPAMRNKVVVLDPKPLDDLSSGMRSYIYNPATPFDSGTAGSDPGIPSVSRHVQLSFASFDSPALTNPPGASGPTFAANPMIGTNQLTIPQANQSPGVTIAYKGKQATGSFLLDTGAQSSFISTEMALQLGITLQEVNGQPHLFWTDPVTLSEVDITAVSLPLGGIGGQQSLAGFNLSSLLIRTEEGDAAADNDPNHLRFLDAPVFVNDISVVDPTDSSKIFTLDGVLGMNFLVASTFFDPNNFDPMNPFGLISQGNFNWLVLDMFNGQLGFDLKAAPVPLPSSLILFFSALMIALRTSRRARRGQADQIPALITLSSKA